MHRSPARPNGAAASTSLALLLATLFTTGCGGGEAGPATPTATVRDSAGVTLVENPLPPAALTLPWSLAATPEVDIGALGGDEPYQLYQAQDAHRLDDGRILVANSGSGEIRVYDAQGTYLAAWGRQGEGPGEFQSPTIVSPWPGSDSIAVWDRRAQRLTLFSGNGTFGRTFPLQQREDMQAPNFVAALPAGPLVVSGMQFRMEDQGMTRLPTAFATVGRTGDFLADLGTWPGAETVMQIGENMVAITQVPFARTTVAAPVGDEMIIAPNEGFELPFRASDGTLTRIVRVAIPPTPITDEVWSAEVERRVSAAPEQAQPGLRSNLEGMTDRPPTLPVFDKIVEDPSGHVWIRMYRPPVEADRPHRWLVLDATGQIQGWVETPAALDVYRIGSDYLLGRARDDLDVEHVQLWRLSR